MLFNKQHPPYVDTSFAGTPGTILSHVLEGCHLPAAVTKYTNVSIWRSLQRRLKTSLATKKSRVSCGPLSYGKQPAHPDSVDHMSFEMSKSRKSGHRTCSSADDRLKKGSVMEHSRQVVADLGICRQFMREGERLDDRDSQDVWSC